MLSLNVTGVATEGNATSATRPTASSFIDPEYYLKNYRAAMAIGEVRRDRPTGSLGRCRRRHGRRRLGSKEGRLTPGRRSLRSSVRETEAGGQGLERISELGGNEPQPVPPHRQHVVADLAFMRMLREPPPGEASNPGLLLPGYGIRA